MPTVTLELEQDVYTFAQEAGDALPDKGGAAAYITSLVQSAFDEQIKPHGVGNEASLVGNEPN